MGLKESVKNDLMGFVNGFKKDLLLKMVKMGY